MCQPKPLRLRHNAIFKLYMWHAFSYLDRLPCLSNRKLYVMRVIGKGFEELKPRGGSIAYDDAVIENNF